MADFSDIPDSTDWLPTPLSLLSPLESSLRCQVCKDFFQTPMITSCAHTFCSLCIRRCFASDGKCPACRASDNASRLRRNWGLEETVEAFKAARSQALEVARTAIRPGQRQERHQSGSVNRVSRQRTRKRTAEIAELEEETGRSSRRNTRSQAKRAELLSSSQPEVTDLEEVEASEDDEESEPEVTEKKVVDAQPNDGLVPCPMCSKRMKEEAVFPHLDRCEEEQQQERKAARQRRSSSQTRSHTPQQPTHNLTRLPTLNYSLLKDRALAKKLQELGIPGWGSKQLLTRRHTEWINLWNSNCDSSRPRTKQELLQDLANWERSQGGHARDTGTTPTVMRKDFDGNEWAQSNSDQFASLIAAARAKRKAAKTDDQSDIEKQEPDNTTAIRIDPRPGDNQGAQNPFNGHQASSRFSSDATGVASPAIPPILADEHSLNHIREIVDAADNDTIVPSPPPPVRYDHEPPTESQLRNTYPAMPAQPPVDRNEHGPVEHATKLPMFEMPTKPVADVESSVTGS